MNERWSLDALYRGYDDPQFEKDFARLGELCAAYDRFTASLAAGDPAAQLRALLLRQEELSQLAARLSAFAGLQTAADSRDGQSASWLGRIQTVLSGTAAAATRARRFVAGLPQLEELIAADPLLGEYAYLLRTTRDDARYLLSEQAEEILAKMDISGGAAWGDLQSYLTSNVTADYRGERLGLAAVRNLAYSRDPAVRRDAYEAELKSYERIRDSVAFSLNSIKKQVLTESALRGFSSPLAETLRDSRMRPETLEALLGAIREYLPKFRAYLRAKGRALGHENGLPWYDLFAPMGRMERTYTTEQARDELLTLFSAFDGELRDTVARAFREEWIDFYPREGKQGGAFCSALFPVGQFRVLTNFGGAFSDVSTLAHELGHGFHDMCVMKAHRPLNGDYSMPVAETASNFNELILADAAYARAQDDQERLALLEGGLQDVCQIICDIYSRYLFESAVFARRENEFMFADELCAMMLEAQEQAYGDGLDPQLRHPYMWACKGHYYSSGLSFYNFPYAFGGLFARGLFAQYKREGAAFVPRYKALLRATTVGTVEDTAALAGIDLTRPDFWRAGLQGVAEQIDRFLALVK